MLTPVTDPAETYEATPEQQVPMNTIVHIGVRHLPEM